jgi:hypothetical protein
MSDKLCPLVRLAITLGAVHCQTLIVTKHKQHEANGQFVCRDKDEGDGVTAGGTDGVEFLTVGNAGFVQS